MFLNADGNFQVQIQTQYPKAISNTNVLLGRYLINTEVKENFILCSSYLECKNIQPRFARILGQHLLLFPVCHSAENSE